MADLRLSIFVLSSAIRDAVFLIVVVSIAALICVLTYTTLISDSDNVGAFGF